MNENEFNNSNELNVGGNNPKKSKAWIFILILFVLIVGFAVGGLVGYVSSDKKDNDTSLKDEDNDNKKDDEKEKSTATPLIYEVTKGDSDTKIYLFGSIHVADDEAYPLPDLVLDAYEESDYLAVELDIIEYENDMDAQMKLAQDMLITDGKTVKDYLKKETYDKLIDYLKENNFYNSLYEYYRPVLFESLVSNIVLEKTDLSTDKGIDRYFLKQAKKDKKEILEVESAEFQNNMLLGFPDELYDFMISYTIDNEDESVKDTQKLYKIWLKGNEKEFNEYLNKEEEFDLDKYDYKDLEKALENYDLELITKRNVSMADKAEEYFKDGKDVFYVVGAAHIVGDDALVELLTERGYTVKRLEY